MRSTLSARSRTTFFALAVTAMLFAVPTTGTGQSPGSGLDLAGYLTYVTLGPAPGLNTATFTLELWFRRDGLGQAVSTGSGGVTGVPLISKGRSEGSENTTHDLNYFLGIDAVTGKLIADLEQGASGTDPGRNEFITGTTTIARDRWYHAAATYDGTTWRLYVNGVLDAE